MEKKFVANKAFLINSQGKILCVRDAGRDDHSDMMEVWDVPGGRMEVGESPLEGLVREVKEEVGIEIDPMKAKPFGVGLWGVKGDVVNEPIVGIFYEVSVGDVSVHLSDEHTHYEWIDPRQSIDEKFVWTIQQAIKDYRMFAGIQIANDRELIGHQGFGLIQLITGNGKGKTTSATGLMVRAVGASKRVGVVYFDKGGESHYFERDTLRKLGVDLVATGRDRIDPVTGRFDFSIQQIDRDEAVRGLIEVQRMFDVGYDLVVMDEINSTTDLGMVSVERVLELIEKKPANIELILTGRNAPQVFLDRAHLVSEVGLKKHYFYSGVKAREGLDY